MLTTMLQVAKAQIRALKSITGKGWTRNLTFHSLGRKFQHLHLHRNPLKRTLHPTVLESKMTNFNRRSNRHSILTISKNLLNHSTMISKFRSFYKIILRLKKMKKVLRYNHLVLSQNHRSLVITS